MSGRGCARYGAPTVRMLWSRHCAQDWYQEFPGADVYCGEFNKAIPEPEPGPVPTLTSIRGNMGSGKTTRLIDYLSMHRKWMMPLIPSWSAIWCVPSSPLHRQLRPCPR